MAKIVDKLKKRKEIALSCKDLFLEKGMKVTVSALANASNIGKGTIYEYFKNKEDIVFEILDILVEEYNEEFFKKLKNAKDTFEKLLIFAEFFYSSEDSLKKIYKEFLSILLTSSNKALKDYSTKVKLFYYDVLDSILKDGVNKKELKKEAIFYKKIIYSMCEGLFLESEVTNLIDNKKKEFEKELRLIYELLSEKIERKKNEIKSSNFRI